MQHEVTPRNLAALIPPPLIVQRDDGLLRHGRTTRRDRSNPGRSRWLSPPVNCACVRHCVHDQ
jgi:hypothetical protein